jgi:hypothetical protein
MSKIYRYLFGILFLVILAFLFTAFNIKNSRAEGRLSTISNYDDVVYLNKASSIYFLSHIEGGKMAAREFFTASLHSPFSVFNAILGFLVFGHNSDSVYYALSLVVLTYLLGVGFLARRLSDSFWLMIIGVALAVPFASLAAVEFRPDLMWATLLGFTGVVLIGESGFFSKRQYSCFFGVALGLILLVKPSTFAMTILVLGGSWFLAAFQAWLTREATIRDLLQYLSISLFAAALVCGWYWFQHGREIFDYFYSNSFGANQDVWSYRGSLFELYTYYFRGVALESNLGMFWIPFLVLYLAGGLMDLIFGHNLRQRLRGGSFLWMLFCLALVNSIFGMKSPFLGGSLYGFIIFGAIFYAVEILTTLTKRAVIRSGFQWAIAIVLLFFAWGIHSFPSASKVNKEAAANQKIANLGAFADLDDLVHTGQSILFTQGNPIVPEFLQMELRSRGKIFKPISGAFCRTLSDMMPLIAQSDFLFLQDLAIIGAPGDMIPSEKLQPEIKMYVDATPEWQLVNTYSLTHGKNVYLYQKTPIISR